MQIGLFLEMISRKELNKNTLFISDMGDDFASAAINNTKSQNNVKNRKSVKK